MDNANLQELFPKEVSSNISIKAGDVAFHFNRKLCYHKITDFLKKINVKYTDSDVSPLTNGDQIPCKYHPQGICDVIRTLRSMC